MSTICFAADTEVQDLDAISSPAVGDVLYVVDDPSGTPASKKITIGDLLGVGTDLNTSGEVTGGDADTATLATTVTVSDDESTDDAQEIVFTTDNANLESDGTCTYNPSTGVITTTGFAGALTGNVTGDCSGNAGTATALAANPADCASNQFATTIGANGDLTCAAIADADVPNDITVDLATLATTVTITDNESTAENNPIVFVADGDLDGGNLGLESDGTCYYTPSTGIITATGFAGSLTGNVTGDASGNAGTATALAANGANCGAGEYPAGVDASGAVESCTDATTEITTAIETKDECSEITNCVPNAWDALTDMALTDAYIYVGNASNDPVGVAVSGDVTISNAGAVTIGNDKILESMLKAVDTASDEECLTYETTTGDFEWQACGTGSGDMLMSTYDIDTNDKVDTAEDLTCTDCINATEIEDIYVSNTTDSMSGDLTVTGSVTTSTVTTGGTELILTQTGDTYGATALKLRNRTGANGAIFTSALDLVDFAFSPSTSPQANIRYEGRNANVVASGNTDEFQFIYDAVSSPVYSIVIGDVHTRLTTNLILTTGKNFTIGSTQWNSGDSMDGTKVADADLGDIGVSTGVWSVEDDSHDHTTTISGKSANVSDADFGDITVSSGSWSIDADAVTEADLKAVDSPSDEECLTYEVTTGDFEWQSCSVGGSGDNVLIDSSAVVDPDFVSTGDIDFVDTSNTITANIQAEKVTEAMLKAVDTASDEECLTYETTTGDFEWQSCGTGSGADFSWVLRPQEAKLPSSNPMAIDAGNSQWRGLFDDTTAECARWQTVLQPLTGTLKAKIFYSMVSATANDVEFELSVMCVSDGDSADVDTDSFGTADNMTATVPATAGYLDVISDASLEGDTCAEGDLIIIKICRDADDATNDDATGDAEFRGAYIYAE